MSRKSGPWKTSCRRRPNRVDARSPLQADKRPDDWKPGLQMKRNVGTRRHKLRTWRNRIASIIRAV
jgi:hypothetical protein